MDPEVFVNINSKKKITSVEAAAIFGVTNDYITQLCRKGKINGELVGRMWSVEEESVKTYLTAVRSRTAARRENLSKQLRDAGESRRTESEDVVTLPLVELAAPIVVETKQKGRGMLRYAAFALVFMVLLSGASSLPTNSFGQEASIASAVSSWWHKLFNPTPSTQSPVSRDTVPTATSTLVSSVTNNTYTNVYNNTYNTYQVSTAGNSTSQNEDVYAQLKLIRGQIADIYSGSNAPMLAYAPVMRIDKLSNLVLTNVSVNGVSGLTPSDIPALPYLSTEGGTLSGALDVSATGTSTFAGGINITGGCLSFNGSCISTGGSASVAGSNTQVQYNDGGGFGASASFAFDKNIAQLTVTNVVLTNSTTTNATTTNSFASNARINNLILGSLQGPLQAINGVVSATSTLSIAFGGTGLSVVPVYGQVLVGDGSGGYALVATSSLGIVGGGTGIFSTTSTNYWASTGLSFSTSSAQNFATLFRDWSVQGSGYLAPTTTRESSLPQVQRSVMVQLASLSTAQLLLLAGHTSSGMWGLVLHRQLWHLRLMVRSVVLPLLLHSSALVLISLLPNSSSMRQTEQVLSGAAPLCYLQQMRHAISARRLIVGATSTSRALHQLPTSLRLIALLLVQQLLIWQLLVSSMLFSRLFQAVRSSLQPPAPTTSPRQTSSATHSRTTRRRRRSPLMVAWYQLAQPRSTAMRRRLAH